MTSSRLFGRLAALVLSTWLLTSAASADAAPTIPRPAPPPGVKTNPAQRPRISGIRTNLPGSVAAKHPGTNSTAKVSGPQSGTSTWLARFQGWQRSPVFYPAVGGGLLCLALVFVLRASRAKARATSLTVTSSKLGPKPLRSGGNGTISSCNVLEFGQQARHLWQFDARAGGFVLNREQTCLEGQSLPRHVVGKDWRTFFQRRLNIAWLPPENVFLRVVQLPRSDLNETLAMVELQLEKLSPMPVAQIAWSLHILPHAEGNLQTVVVIMVERSVVEEFLGRLEGQGFLPDRLELPLLDQLQTTAITEDGAWIYPEAAAGKNTALVAWWYKGVLQNLDLLTMPAANKAAGLKEQLLQMAWAGELEGWLCAPPEWHLVADVGAADWEPALREGLEQPFEVLTPRPARELAALTARRSAHTEPRANLMPPEFATRYRQQFVDRLWMRGLLAVGCLYLLGVAVYMVGLGYASYRTDGVEAQVALLGPTYTNAIQLRDRFKVLKERQELKYAGLDCWSTTAKLLRENMTLDSLNFSDGRRLNLAGTAPADQTDQLYAFEGDMRKATVRGEPLFDPNKGESIQFRVQGPTASWTLSLELKRSEVQ